MTRMTFLAAACGMLVSSHVRAGDVATAEILGFSSDGRIFAFEEYGVQDGSGFPYANRYYVDTGTDEFLPGTPIRVRIDDESATTAAARREARTQGEAVVAAEDLAAHPGFTAGWNGVTESSADPTRMAVNPRPVFPPIDPPLEVRLEEFGVETPERCRDLGDAKGFRLLRIGTSPGAQTSMLHEDKTIPQSRDCPLGYRIGGIQTFYPEAGSPVFAVLIAVRRVGFEGPDFRWMAVTGRLN